MKALLITTRPDQWNDLQEVVKKNFVGLNLECSTSEANAIEIINFGGTIAFYIIDAKSEFEDASSILNNLMDMSGERPTLIIGENDDLAKINSRLLFLNPNNSFIEDPYNLDALKEVVDKALSWTEESKFDEQSVGENPDDYTPMKLKNFYFYSSFPLDIYAQISSSQFVKSFEKDTKIYEAQLQKYSQRKIHTLYIKKDQHLDFLQNSMDKASKFFKENIKFSKTLIMGHMRATSIIQDYLKHVGATHEIIDFSEDLIENIFTSLVKEKDYKSVLKAFPKKFQGTVSKSILTVYTLNFLLDELKMTAETTKKRFFLAAIIQDTFIENDDLSSVKTLSDSRLEDLDEKSKEQLIEHPKLIANLAQQYTSYSELDFLLAKHHELPTRDGFPSTPSASEMQLSTCVFNIAHNFSADLDDKQVSPDAIAGIVSDYKSSFNLGNFKPCYAALLKLFS